MLFRHTLVVRHKWAVRHTLFLLALAPVALLASGGCMFLEAPPVAPTPTPPPPLPPVVFDASAGQPRGSKLNSNGDPLDPKAVMSVPTPGVPTPAPPAPHAFFLYRADAGDLLVLQPMNRVKTGVDKDNNPVVSVKVGAPDVLNPVQLAGIICPKPPSVGAANAIAAVTNWCAGQELDVDIDPKYPEDARGRRLVHVFYKGRAFANDRKTPGPYAGQTLSLNRMMVRSGYAIVDLYSPTSFDQKEWLIDETFARKNRRGLWQTNAFALLQQRLPSTGTGARANVTVRTGARPGATPGAKTPKVVTLPPGVKVTPPPVPSGPSAPVPASVGGANPAGAPGGPPGGPPPGASGGRPADRPGGN